MILEIPFFVFVAGLVSVTLIDTLGAIASRKLKFPYTWLIPLSLAVYVIMGCLLGKMTGYTLTVFYSALLGLYDGTIGLRLSIYYKANTGLDESKVQKLQDQKIAIYMLLMGVVFGSAGYRLA